jgi:hypothetical protein
MTDTRSPVEILRAARARIADPSHWCRLVYAESKFGNSLADERSPRAVKWCAAGALYAERRGPRSRGITGAVLAARDILQKAAEPLCLTQFNDERSHAAVMAMYDRAIALAEEAEAANA